MLANDIGNETYSLTFIQLKTVVVNHYNTSADRILRKKIKIMRSCFFGMITGLLVPNYHFLSTMVIPFMGKQELGDIELFL